MSLTDHNILSQKLTVLIAVETGARLLHLSVCRMTFRAEMKEMSDETEIEKDRCLQ